MKLYKLSYFAFVLVVLAVALLFSPKTGLLSYSIVDYEYTEHLDQVKDYYSSSGSYFWQPKTEGEITSLQINGKIDGTGTARIFLIRGGKQHLIYRQSVSENYIDIDEEQFVDYGDGTDIGLTIDYGDGKFDEDNDGVATFSDGVDFELSPYFFTSLDKQYMCSVWEVYSADENVFTSSCFGNEDCCGFLDFQSQTDDWDDDFVLVHGQYGATENNMVLGRLVYYDGNEAVYSNYDYLPAHFIDNIIDEEVETNFERIFDSNKYFLKIELDKETGFQFDTIRYTVRSVREDEEPEDLPLTIVEEVQEDVIETITVISNASGQYVSIISGNAIDMSKYALKRNDLIERFTPKINFFKSPAAYLLLALFVSLIIFVMDGLTFSPVELFKRRNQAHIKKISKIKEGLHGTRTKKNTKKSNNH